MSRTYSVYEQNFAHFKFLSQHFHKSLAISTDGPELKGIKAHDRFAKLFGWQSLNEVNQYLRGYNKRLHDFGELKMDQIVNVYRDLYPEIPTKDLFEIYYDFFHFSHHSRDYRHLSFKTLKELKSITFFPKYPDWNMGEIADNLAVALDSFSSFFRGRCVIDRNLLNSALMLYFDFYDKKLIADFNWQDIADLTHPNCYHDAFVKYKTQLKPKFKFVSAASHCYDKFSFYIKHEHQVSAHQNICSFLSEVAHASITPQGNKEAILFYKVYQVAAKDGLATIDAPNSFEVNKGRRLTLDDFDFSKVKVTNFSSDSGEGEADEEVKNEY